MKKLVAIIVAFIGYISTSFSQCGDPGAFCMTSGTISTCSGTFYDSGGADSYSDDLITMTICPDTPGDVIQLDFGAFNLQQNSNPDNSDYLNFFDGNSTSALSLGSYTGTSLQGFTVTGTINNTSGCITIVFDPNGPANTTFAGWEAQISCTTPCANPTADSQLISSTAAPYVDGAFPWCVGLPLELDGTGSFAEAGFTIAEYAWNFDDGTIDVTSGATASHTFTEPGEYLVSLTVTDNNGCSNLNLEPIRILVSTVPQFVDLAESNTDFCIGETGSLVVGDISSPLWTSAPPSVVAGQTYLADGVGFSFDSPLTFDFFAEGQVLEDCADLMDIFVNMEHTYMGDLNVQITCPNGTVVTVVQQPNGGAGTYLGQPDESDTPNPGVGWDYAWAPTANTGTWGENAQDPGVSLPAGTYESEGDLCDLVGCPLNGTWTFNITDYLLADNGTIFAWGINFNPALYPGVTTFQPEIIDNFSSSSWSGPGITFSDPVTDSISFYMDTPGTYDYVFEVVNSFGCVSDTTITVNFEQAPLITAGPDQIFNCEPLLLTGGFQDLPTPVCTVAEGNYTYCYGENDNYIQTFCPDNPGDGISAVEITFNSGSTENFFDEFYVYDGDDTNAPLLAGPLYGDLSGMVFTATNPDGCLTIQIQSDGSVSCASGSQTELNFDVGCASPFDYEWAWTPSTNLNPSSSPVTTLTALSETTVFTLTGYPTGHPLCVVTDDVVVEITQDMTIDVEEIYEACLNAEVNVLAPTITGGTGPYDINWTSETGQNINGDEIFVTAAEPTEYCATVEDQCGTIQTACTTVQAYPSIPASFSISNPIGCEPLSVLMVSDYTEYQNVESMIWHFEDGDAISVMGSANHEYNNEGTYYPWLEIIDDNGCIYYDTIASPVSVFPTPFAAFNVAPTELILPNTTANFDDISIDASEYVYTFDQLGFGYSADTAFTFPAEVAATYNVQLWVTNQFGCVDSTVRQVIIRDDIDVYIPSAFTPDGDGINDVWQIKGAGFTSLNYHMVVFNRWGDVVFESTDPNQAWTGGYQNGGYFVQDGLYFYRAEIQDVEYDVKYLYEGHVLIAR